MKAEILIEYVAFNKTPKNFEELPENQRWHFTQPIRVFGFDRIGKVEAERWCREANVLRNKQRDETRMGLEVDNVAGELIDVEVRQRMVIFGEYERTAPDSLGPVVVKDYGKLRVVS